MLFNKERCFKIMDENGIDVLIAAAPENVTYTSEFWSLTHWIIPQFHSFVIMPRYGHPTLVQPLLDADLTAVNPPWFDDIIYWGGVVDRVTAHQPCTSEASLNSAEKRLDEVTRDVKPRGDPIDALIDVIMERGFENKKLGLDGLGIASSVWENIKKKLPKAEVVDAHQVFREVRMVKTEDEIKRLKKGAEITENAYKSAIEIAGEGVADLEIIQRFNVAGVEKGATPLFTIVGCGTESAFVNSQGSNYRLKMGDNIRFDVGFRYKSYCSDIARTIVLGQPDEKQRRYLNAIVKGEKRAVEIIKPGVKASELYKITMKTIWEEGIPHCVRYHCGHGIGLNVYDRPLIVPENQTPLEVGMVLCIETGYYEVGFGGFQSEDMIVVTRDGCEPLTLVNLEDLTI